MWETKGSYMNDQIYVALLDEGTDVWRPAPALKLQDETYVVLRPDDYDPAFEQWQFPPGTMVVCEQKQLSGAVVTVAVRQTKDVRRTA